MKLSKSRLLVAAALVIVAVLGTTMPAGAVLIVPSPAPINGGSAGSSGGGSGSFRCVDGRGVDVVGRIWFDNYPGCAGYRHTGNYMFCPTGFEVWRFWGDVGRPIEGSSVSKVNIGSHDCNQENVLFADIHTEDSRQQVWTGATPWRTASNRELNTPDRWGEAMYNSMTNYGGSTYYTTNFPFAFHGANCTTQQARNTRLQSYQPGGANQGDPLAESVRNWLRSRYITARDRMGSAWAVAAFDVNAIVNDHLVTGDGYNCSSAFDYQARIPDGASTETHPDSKILGMCFIPTLRWSEQFAGAYGYWYQGRRLVFPNGEFQGSRDIYAGYASGQNPTLSPNNWQLNNARNLYRNAVFNEVMNRPDTALYANGALHPPSIYGNHSGPYNRPAAASYARDHSYCTSTYAGTWYESAAVTESPGTAAGTAVELNVVTPEVGQVGGLLRAPAQISTAPGRVMCGATPCPPSASGPTIRSINNSTVTLTPPSADADWRVRPGSPNSNLFTPPGTFRIPTSGTAAWSLDFFKATKDEERYRVTVDGGATIRTTANGSSNMSMCFGMLFQGTFDGCSQIGGTGTVTQDRDVPLVVNFNNGTPRTGQNTFPVIGATATPIEDRQG